VLENALDESAKSAKIALALMKTQRSRFVCERGKVASALARRPWRFLIIQTRHL
jgi:hypothetical protein